MNLKIFSIIGGILALAGIGWAIYAGILRPVLKPNPSTNQKADSITNHYYTPKTTFGCINFRIKNAKPITNSETLPVNDTDTLQEIPVSNTNSTD